MVHWVVRDVVMVNYLPRILLVLSKPHFVNLSRYPCTFKR